MHDARTAAEVRDNRRRRGGSPARRGTPLSASAPAARIGVPRSAQR
jgi:hypothetical protein